jgi:hypothetical protein
MTQALAGASSGPPRAGRSARRACASLRAVVSTTTCRLALRAGSPGAGALYVSAAGLGRRCVARRPGSDRVSIGLVI